MDTRFHGLDFCRAIFMSLGILFHCGLIYGAGQEWRVVSDQTSAFLSLLSNFIHHFRMEAFYLVSGFFYLLLMEKGRTAFLSERLCRVTIPMVVVGCSLNVGMNLLSDNWFYHWDVSYVLTGKWLGHLWFLGNLVVYFLVVWPFCGHLKRALEGCSARQWFYLTVLLAGIAVMGQGVSAHFQWRTLVFINFGYLPYYFCYFLMGLIAYRCQPHFFQCIRAGNAIWFVLLYIMLQGLSRVLPGLQESHQDTMQLVSHFPLMLAVFSVLNLLGSRNAALVRQVSDASYSIYLLHQPLIILFYAVLFEGVRWGAYLEYGLLVVSVFTTAWLIHRYLISRLVLLSLLFNGNIKWLRPNPASLW